MELIYPDDIQENRAGTSFLTEPRDLAAVSKALTAPGWGLQASGLHGLAKTFPELSPEQQEEAGAFLSALDDHGDVHRVYDAVK